MSTAKVIAPTTFVKATHLVDSNAGETVSLWNSGTTYALADTARYGDRIYESLQGSNTNKQPDTQPTWWLDTGPSNTTAMFDQQSSTSSSRSSPLTAVINAPNVNALALINLSGVATVTVTGTDGVGGTEIYSRTESISDDAISGWYDFFFATRSDTADVVLTDLPTRPTLVLTVTMEGTGTVGCGALLFGRATELGGTLASPKVGILDYSRKTTDEYGTTTFVARAWSKRVSAALHIDNTRLNRIFRTLGELRATPSVWIFDEQPRYSGLLIVYGFFRDFSIDIPYPEHSRCSLEIEGLT
jgi:hypothetical protein